MTHLLCALFIVMIEMGVYVDVGSVLFVVVTGAYGYQAVLVAFVGGTRRTIRAAPLILAELCQVVRSGAAARPWPWG